MTLNDPTSGFASVLTYLLGGSCGSKMGARDHGPFLEPDGTPGISPDSRPQGPSHADVGPFQIDTGPVQTDIRSYQVQTKLEFTWVPIPAGNGGRPPKEFVTFNDFPVFFP